MSRLSNFKIDEKLTSLHCLVHIQQNKQFTFKYVFLRNGPIKLFEVLLTSQLNHCYYVLQ